MEDERETSALRHRRKKSSMGLSSCFHRRRGSFDSSSSAPLPSPNLKSSPPSWLRSKGHELPEFRGKCRSLMSKMGRHRHHLSDFSYDPLSYPLNFEEDDHGVAETEEAPFRDFSSRLPSSPPTPRAVEGTQRLAPLNVEMQKVKKRVEVSMHKGKLEKVARLPLSSPTSRSGSPVRRRRGLQRRSLRARFSLKSVRFVGLDLAWLGKGEAVAGLGEGRVVAGLGLARFGEGGGYVGVG
ncbi:hypothetical protein RJ639_020791 [Escallonia herrerae]|uniref:Uncharacterized protein n=1 Tax=Escallonia herrerae TaxID=1293975 RepID=A0AA89AGK7_9ASTE|nr:hypothetical protein RJ639_020791 [Escallonia herrerae]